MALQDKYKELIDAATAAPVVNLQVREQDGVLYIDGESSGAVKQQLCDLMLNINSNAGISEGAKLKVTTNRTNLNIRSGPSTNDSIVGKAARHEIVTLVRKENDQWWYIQTKDGEEGYSYTQYLTPVEA